MRPTKYNSRITVQKSTQTESEIKGLTNVWSDLFTCWASVLPVKGFKRLQYASLEMTEIYEVEMRARQTNPSVLNRVVYGGDNYQIIALQVNGEKVNMDIAR